MQYFSFFVLFFSPMSFIKKFSLLASDFLSFSLPDPVLNTLQMCLLFIMQKLNSPPLPVKLLFTASKSSKQASAVEISLFGCEDKFHFN